MAETVDLTLVLERLNELMGEVRIWRSDVRDLKGDVSNIKMHMSTRSHFLAIADSFNQFDSLLASLDGRVAMIETRLTQ